MKISKIAVYCGSYIPSEKIYSESAEKLGKFLAANNITLVFGGSAMGTMKIIADAVLENNGKAIGVFPAELPKNLLHPGLTEVFYSNNLAERKAKMLELADALIALPGSMGTWDELFDALAVCKISRGKKSMPIIALNINGFYNPLKDLINNSVEAGFTSKEASLLLTIIDNIDDLANFFDLKIDFLK